MGGEQFIQGRLRFEEKSAARRKFGLLTQQSDAGAGMEANVAVVGLVGADEQRKSVVLPAPLGPTRPTRSPACNSKPTFSNSGPSSKLRERWEQLRSSIVCVAPWLAATRRGAREKRPSSFG